MPSSNSALSPSSSSNKKKAKGVGGNALKIWPAPKWQKNLHAFLGVEQPDSSGSADGASSSGNTSLQETDVATDEQLAGMSSDSGSSCQGSSSMASGIGLLSGDIAQLNSDDDDDE